VKKTYRAHTDGSCLGNPGVGGFASIIEADGVQHIIKGYSKNPRSTNNGMELEPVVQTALWIVRNKAKHCVLEVYTDSQYLCSCWNHDAHWLMTSERPNHRAWALLIDACNKHDIELKFIKVNGHSGVTGNERADKLAREQAIKARHIVFGGLHE